MISLGFQNSILFVFTLFWLIIGVVIRWKWNRAVERRQEIIRLVAMASEESARVEFQAAAEYRNSLAVPVVRHSQCAVCYCPTTTRCARCKAVRYCSGKCQIIHWRRGHKDECYPPNMPLHFNGPDSDTDQKAVSQRDQEEVYANGTEIKVSAKPIETYMEAPKSIPSTFEDDGKFGQAPVSSDSFSTSSLVGRSATVNERHNDAYACELPVSSTTEGFQKPQSNKVDQGVLDAADVNHTNLIRPSQSDYNALDVSVGTISPCGLTDSLGSSINTPDGSQVPKLSIPNSDFWEEALDSNRVGEDIDYDSARSSFGERNKNNLDHNKSPSHASCNLTQHDPNSQSQCPKPRNLSDDVILEKKSFCGVPQSEKIVTDATFIKNTPRTEPEKLTCVGNSSGDSQLLEGGGAKSLSSSVTCDNRNSGSGGQPLSNFKSSSVRKVVQPFKVYKLSKQYATGFEFESAKKHSYKMLFPYDLFVKLYHWNRVELRPCGLTNCGNSCYANAVFQCLAFTRPLTVYLLQGFHSKKCPKKGSCFMCEFEGLILKAKEGTSPLSPIGMLSQLQNIGNHLGHGREEDAHEFLRYVIDTMQSVCLKESGEMVASPLVEETTLIGLIFGGYLCSKIKCMKCHGKSERRERMMDLTVEIHGDIGTLEEALKNFTASEMLDGENKYNCLSCKSYEKAKKKLTILEAPNVLTIALKRFQSGKFGKLNKRVHFPEILDLAPYMSGTSDKSPIYRLYAVVVHLDTKNATFSGHYVCYVRIIQGKWFNINDSTVEPVELERVLSERAYMLFYARCSPRAPSLIRNTMVTRKIKDRPRCTETNTSIRSGAITSGTRLGSTDPRAGPFTEQRSPEDYWRPLDRPHSFEHLDSLRFHPTHGIPRADSLSDNSSIFSCSDEGSCTTDSTRDSTSNDDFPDYMYVETGRSWNSPSMVLEDSDKFSPSEASERHTSGFRETSEYPSYWADVIFQTNDVSLNQSRDGSRMQEGWQDKGNNTPILHSNTSKYDRRSSSYSNNSSHNGSDSSRETEMERLGGYKPLDVNSGVSHSRSTRERIVKTIY